MIKGGGHWYRCSADAQSFEIVPVPKALDASNASEEKEEQEEEGEDGEEDGDDDYVEDDAAEIDEESDTDVSESGDAKTEDDHGEADSPELPGDMRESKDESPERQLAPSHRPGMNSLVGVDEKRSAGSRKRRRLSVAFSSPMHPERAEDPQAPGLSLSPILQTVAAEVQQPLEFEQQWHPAERARDERAQETIQKLLSQERRGERCTRTT